MLSPNTTRGSAVQPTLWPYPTANFHVPHCYWLDRLEPRGPCEPVQPRHPPYKHYSHNVPLHPCLGFFAHVTTNTMWLAPYFRIPKFWLRGQFRFISIDGSVEQCYLVQLHLWPFLICGTLYLLKTNFDLLSWKHTWVILPRPLTNPPPTVRTHVQQKKIQFEP